jgi:ribonuclease-3 family protein
MTDLRTRSVRTLAWLGDAVFETEVRRRLAETGDWPVDRLNRACAMVVRAEAQAALLQTVEPTLNEAEQGVVRRARNAEVRGGGRATRDVKAYRSATALEALIGWWHFGGDAARVDEVLSDALAQRVTEAVERAAPIKRG